MSYKTERYLYTNILEVLQRAWPVPWFLDDIADQVGHRSLTDKVPRGIRNIATDISEVRLRLNKLAECGLVIRQGSSRSPIWILGNPLDDQMPPIPDVDTILSMLSS